MNIKKGLLLIGLLLVTVFLSRCGKDTASSQATEARHLYMDIHKNVEGLTAEAVASAHKKDLEVQDKYGVKYLKYWYNAES